MKNRDPMHVWAIKTPDCDINKLRTQYKTKKLGDYLNMFDGQLLKYIT